MKSLIFLILFSYLVCEVECGAAPAAPPNIVFILIDDLRYDTFGYMGHPFVETPHIDALAKGGMPHVAKRVEPQIVDQYEDDIRR